jgi:L-ribulose-5-phosphate 3-epimerase
MNRRSFLKSAAGAALALGVGTIGGAEAAEGASTAGKERKLKKALIVSMFPGSMSMEDQFKLAGDMGLDGMEVGPTSDANELRAMRAASEKSGVRIHSIIYGGWKALLSSPDPAVVEQGMKQTSDAIKCAKELGADNVLLVPARVDGVTRYVEAYDRSQKQIRKLIPEAEKAKVMILVENVWNNFLLSPLEFARFIDEINSPWVQAYFDVGNVVAFGWPEDWIRTLGHRIKKVHLKDFTRGPRQWVNLRDGDVNWPEVRKALAEVGYGGYLTAELSGGDENYLRDVCARIDKIINEKS